MGRCRSFLCAIGVSHHRHSARHSQSEQLLLRFLCKTRSADFSTLLLRANRDLSGRFSLGPWAPTGAIGSGPRTLLPIPVKLDGTLEGAMGLEHPRPFLVSRS